MVRDCDRNGVGRGRCLTPVKLLEPAAACPVVVLQLACSPLEIRRLVCGLGWVLSSLEADFNLLLNLWQPQPDLCGRANLLLDRCLGLTRT